jgi:DHA3 family tetracycline resistance protein-like MFS transporter
MERAMKTFEATKAFYLFEGGRGLLLNMIFTASALYQVSVVGLTPFQLVLVGTFLEAVYFLFQIPTGVVADVYSRKWSVIIGFVLIGTGFLIEGMIPTFAAVMTAQAFWGIGATFTDGALEAWLTDEIGEEATGKAMLRLGQIGSVTYIVGVLFVVVIGSLYNIAAPIWLCGALLIVLGVSMIGFVPETGFKRKPKEERKHPLVEMSNTFREGVKVMRAKPILLTLTLASLVNGLYSEGYDRLGTAHLVRSIGFPAVFGTQFQEVQWIGAISIVGALIGIGMNEIVRRKVDLNSDAQAARWLIVGTVILSISILAFAWAGNIVVALIGYWISGFLRGGLHPILFTWSNRQISGVNSGVRATVLSMWSQADALGQIAGGPAVGAIGNTSIRLALTASGLLVGLKLPLYVKANRM